MKTLEKKNPGDATRGSLKEKPISISFLYCNKVFSEMQPPMSDGKFRPENAFLFSEFLDPAISRWKELKLPGPVPTSLDDFYRIADQSEKHVLDILLPLANSWKKPA